MGVQVEVIIETLHHDGELLQPGAILDLELDAAGALLNAGAVQKVSQKGAKAANAKPKKATDKGATPKEATPKNTGAKKGSQAPKEADAK